MLDREKISRTEIPKRFARCLLAATGRARVRQSDSPRSRRDGRRGAGEASPGALGLDPGAGLPIHIFVEKASNVRCVRTGAVNEGDYAAVAELVK